MKKEIRVIIRYTKWYDKIIDFFKKPTKEPKYDTRMDLNFSLCFDERFKLIEATQILFADCNGLKFKNREIGD